MADRAISELIAANQVTHTDLFVLEQSGTAKKLTGQILENWLVSFADGHGGIQSIVKKSTSGLVDTYRITLADTTTFDFMVNNGKGIDTIQKTNTSGLVDTYTIQFNDSTSSTFTVTNGAKGDKGDNQYVWIKYASQKPTASSHSFGDVPDNWIGVYSGAADTAPTDWQQYQWFQIKGEKGDTGEPARLTSSAVEYQVSDSGVIVPSGAWSSSVPVVAQGRYLWTRTTTTFNTGSSTVAYSVSRMGMDGSGSVSSVANVSPDSVGNVPLTASDVGALPSAGGEMTGELNMNGQKLKGLNAPTEDDEAATRGFVRTEIEKIDVSEQISSKLSMELIYQNAKTSDEFGEQEIPLKSDNGHFYAIEYYLANTTTTYSTGMFFLRGGTSVGAICERGGFIHKRFVNATNNKFSFSNCQKMQTYGNYVVDNNAMIPYRIYELKGVSV